MTNVVETPQYLELGERPSKLRPRLAIRDLFREAFAGLRNGNITALHDSSAR